MKKITLLSSVIFVIALISFAFVNTQNTLATKTKMTSPQGVSVQFTVKGCANCNVGYCINGGQQKTSSNCTFIEVLPAGNYTICVMCAYGRIGDASFVVTEDGTAFMYVDVKTHNANGEACICSDSKKK